MKRIWTTLVVLSGFGITAWMAATPAAAQSEGPGVRRERPAPPTLAVSGRGDVRVSPDTAVVSVGASQQAKDAQAAQEAVNRVIQGALEKIGELGIEKAHIQTAGIALHPVYEQRPPHLRGEHEFDEPRIVAYRASNTLQVEVHDLAKVGDVIDAAIGAGANQLQGLSYELREDRQAKAESLRKAVDRARGEAEAVAAALGMRVAEIERVEVGEMGFRPPMPMARGMMMADAMMAATPTEPGQVRVDAQVTVVYRLAPAEGDRGERRRGLEL